MYSVRLEMKALFHVLGAKRKVRSPLQYDSTQLRVEVHTWARTNMYTNINRVWHASPHPYPQVNHPFGLCPQHTEALTFHCHHHPTIYFKVKLAPVILL